MQKRRAARRGCFPRRSAALRGAARGARRAQDARAGLARGAAWRRLQRPPQFCAAPATSDAHRRPAQDLAAEWCWGEPRTPEHLVLCQPLVAPDAPRKKPRPTNVPVAKRTKLPRMLALGN